MHSLNSSFFLSFSLPLFFSASSFLPSPNYFAPLLLLLSFFRFWEYYTSIVLGEPHSCLPFMCTYIASKGTQTTLQIKFAAMGVSWTAEKKSVLPWPSGVCVSYRSHNVGSVSIKVEEDEASLEIKRER